MFDLSTKNKRIHFDKESSKIILFQLKTHIDVLIQINYIQKLQFIISIKYLKNG